MGYAEGAGQTWFKMIHTFHENRKQGNINKNFAVEAWDLEEFSFFESICNFKLF